jgi:hypothetical protein
MKNFKKVLNARRLKQQKKVPGSSTESVTTTSSIALMQQYLLEPHERLFTNKPYSICQPEDKPAPDFKKSVKFCNFSYPTPPPTDSLEKSSGNVNSAPPPTANLDDREVLEGDSMNTSSLSSPLSYGLTWSPRNADTPGPVVEDYSEHSKVNENDLSKYGICPPQDFFDDPDHPPLQEKPSEEPELPGWVDWRREANEHLMRQWATQKAKLSILGKGYDHILNSKIVSTIDCCEFATSAQCIVSKLPPIEQICVNKFISELKDKEKEAITKAQIYRNRCEDLILSAKRAEQNAMLREYRVREFWRNSVQEGGTRGGRILRESLKKYGKL